MSHKHNCECSHENVKYCQTCKVCHCLECNQEWSVTPVYRYTYYNYPYSGGLVGNNQAQFTLGSNAGLVNPNDYNKTQVTSHDHK